MSKIAINDYVYNHNRHENGTIVGDRGGYVGRWDISKLPAQSHQARARGVM